MSLINLRILLLKIWKLLAFQMIGSSLFHSEISDGKKVFLKKLWLISVSEITSTFLVTYEDGFFCYLKGLAE